MAGIWSNFSPQERNELVHMCAECFAHHFFNEKAIVEISQKALGIERETILFEWDAVADDNVRYFVDVYYSRKDEEKRIEHHSEETSICCSINTRQFWDSYMRHVAIVGGPIFKYKAKGNYKASHRRYRELAGERTIDEIVGDIRPSMKQPPSEFLWDLLLQQRIGSQIMAGDVHQPSDSSSNIDSTDDEFYQD